MTLFVSLTFRGVGGGYSNFIGVLGLLWCSWRGGGGVGGGAVVTNGCPWDFIGALVV